MTSTDGLIWPPLQKNTPTTDAFATIIITPKPIMRWHKNLTAPSGWMASTVIVSIRGLILSVSIFDKFEFITAPAIILPTPKPCKKTTKLLNS